MKKELHEKLPKWVEENMKILKFAADNNLSTDYVFAFVMSTANEIIGRSCGNELYRSFPFPKFGDKKLYNKYAKLNKYQGVGIYGEMARNYGAIKHGAEGVRECLDILNELIEARNKYSLEYEEVSIKDLFPNIEEYSDYYCIDKLLNNSVINITGTDEYYIANLDPFIVIEPVDLEFVRDFIFSKSVNRKGTT